MLHDFLFTLQMSSFWLSAPLYWKLSVSLKTSMMLKPVDIVQSSFYLTSQHQSSKSLISSFSKQCLTLTPVTSSSLVFPPGFLATSSQSVLWAHLPLYIHPYKSFSRFYSSHSTHWFHILSYPQLPSVCWLFPNFSPYFRFLISRSLLSLYLLDIYLWLFYKNFRVHMSKSESTVCALTPQSITPSVSYLSKWQMNRQLIKVENRFKFLNLISFSYYFRVVTAYYRFYFPIISENLSFLCHPKGQSLISGHHHLSQRILNYCT